MSPSKMEMRIHVKSMFSLMTKEALLEKSEELSAQLFECLAGFKEGITIGAYYPLADEAQWFINWDVNKVRLSFPRIGSNSMEFVLSGLDELKEWRGEGISFRSPPEGNPKVAPDVLLIPGRAFNEKGDRLGRGKGFFDKYLAGFKGTKIGICFDFQIFENIPLEPHDLPMDYVVTEKRILKME
jgi:5-formyltetrahydrofolate cyclo-ligase